MKIKEILSERSLTDVGVRGGKFYLAARGEEMDIDHLAKTGELSGVRGISATREIWGEFSPSVGRDVFIVMPAEETVRINKLTRVQYDDAQALVKNNSLMLGRILSIKDVSRDPGDNIIQGVFDKIPGVKKIGGDRISVANRAQNLAHDQRKGDGLKLSSIEDYANLYLAGAKEAGWYGEDFVKFFSPQNRRVWYPALEKAIIAQANVYSNESEWLNTGSKFIVPKSSTVLLAVPAGMMKGKPVKQTLGSATFADGSTGMWSSYDNDRYDYYQRLIKEFTASGFKVKIVDASKASNVLMMKRGERWTRDAAKRTAD